jgi:penicillin-binding protein 2
MPIAQDNRILIHRLGLLRIVIVLVFLGMGLKLWHLMIVRHQHFEELAQHNQIRTVPLVAPRGPILDREGRVLADSISAFNLLLYRDEAPDLVESERFLVERLGVDRETYRERLGEAVGYLSFRPLLVKENLSMEEMALVLSHRAEHPEFKLVEQPRRLYRYGELAAHVFGYVGEVSRAELDSGEYSYLKAGDVVGKAGIERVYNRRLTGADGHSRGLVNSFGKVLGELSRVDPRSGEALRLTLDLDLQRVAEEELTDRPGAVLAIDPRTGHVLALASRPAFDPNAFAVRITRRQWLELTENPDHPLQNRAIQNTFSPGSIFKLVMAMAGLELGVIDANTSFYCNGAVILYGHRFRCWREGGHGFMRLPEAIQQSCNVYFYLLGQRLGIENIAAFSRKLGLGNPTGIDLRGEAAGLVPSPDWKRRMTGQPWYPGETISVAIGQGPVNVTPAQLARAVGALATGRVPRLTLVDDGGDGRATAPALGFSAENLRVVRQGMWKAVNEWGTGRSARVEHFDVCGKTGTAQTISRQALERLSEKERERFEPNAWFVGFAPREEPEIVVVVIVQRGGSGGGEAAPIAGKILAEYYRKHRADSVPLQLVSTG